MLAKQRSNLAALKQRCPPPPTRLESSYLFLKVQAKRGGPYVLLSRRPQGFGALDRVTGWAVLV